jgi:hypothetical protein
MFLRIIYLWFERFRAGEAGEAGEAGMKYVREVRLWRWCQVVTLVRGKLASK